MVRIALEVPKRLNREQERSVRDLAVLEEKNVTPERKGFAKLIKDFLSNRLE